MMYIELPTRISFKKWVVQSMYVFKEFS